MDAAGGAGGGAGAGIGGNGGNGASGFAKYNVAGQQGEDCGIITISNSIKVYAYGGAGGSGGGTTMNTKPDGTLDVQSGGGGGGFPAAGIGGGGAGGSSGNTQDSGAGFCNGEGDYVNHTIGGINGKSLTTQQAVDGSIGLSGIGGSYYESYACTPAANDGIGAKMNVKPEVLISVANERYNMLTGSPEAIKGYRVSGGIGGGFASGWAYYTTEACLRGGKGGEITVSSLASINAYNGSYITTKPSSLTTDTEKQTTQALIYAQAGYDVKAIRELYKVKCVNARTISALVAEWSQTGYNFSAQRTIASPYDSTCGTGLAGTYVLGIGSGAGGCQDTDGNGTYTIDPTLN